MATHLLAALMVQGAPSNQGSILEALSRCSLWCRLTGLCMLLVRSDSTTYSTSCSVSFGALNINNCHLLFACCVLCKDKSA